MRLLQLLHQHGAEPAGAVVRGCGDRSLFFRLARAASELRLERSTHRLLSRRLFRTSRFEIGDRALESGIRSHRGGRRNGGAFQRFGSGTRRVRFRSIAAQRCASQQLADAPQLGRELGALLDRLVPVALERDGVRRDTLQLHVLNARGLAGGLLHFEALRDRGDVRGFELVSFGGDARDFGAEQRELAVHDHLEVAI